MRKTAILSMLTLTLGCACAPAVAQAPAAASKPATNATAGPAPSGEPLVVTGKRVYRPTWRGPQGRPLKAPPQSWGKPGVSMADYRAQAAECTRRAYDMDLSKTKQADALARATTRIDSLNDQANLSPDPAQAYGDIARQQQQVNYPLIQEQLEEMMQETVDKCLTQLGYRRFHLTDEQRKVLGGLPFGSEARRTYLYSLASDPAVLAAQGTG